ncbi:MAG: hypothetical protein ABEJ58_03535 [Halodesulfurarchaeum sp.]
MSVDRDTLRDAGLATVGVVVFIAFLIAGASMSVNGIGRTGAFVIVGGIVAFVVVMAVIGVLFLGEE